MGRPRSDIRPRIIEAARARFLSEGVDGASLRAIANDAGTNIGMIVYYFRTKDDLFFAVVEDIYSGFVADLEKILGARGSARDRLRGSLVRLGHATDLELDVIRLVLREALSSTTRFRRIVARFMRGHMALLLGAVADGVKAGEFEKRLPAPLILLAVMGMGGVPQLARRVFGDTPFFAALPGVEKLADFSIDALFKAVGAPAMGKSKAANESRPTKRRPK